MTYRRVGGGKSNPDGKISRGVIEKTPPFLLGVLGISLEEDFKGLKEVQDQLLGVEDKLQKVREIFQEPGAGSELKELALKYVETESLSAREITGRLILAEMMRAKVLDFNGLREETRELNKRLYPESQGKEKELGPIRLSER